MNYADILKIWEVKLSPSQLFVCFFQWAEAVLNSARRGTLTFQSHAPTYKLYGKYHHITKVGGMNLNLQAFNKEPYLCCFNGFDIASLLTHDFREAYVKEKENLQIKIEDVGEGMKNRI